MGQFNSSVDRPEIARLGHVALETPDLAESTWFFRDVVGLQEVERADDTVFLRSMFDHEHHTLSLTDAGESGVDHVGWRAQRPEHVEGFADRLECEDVEVTRVDAGHERGQGKAIRFSAPNGHPFEIYYHVEKPDAPPERRSKLKNRKYSGDAMKRGYPRQLDHVNVRDRDSEAHADWLVEHLGFQLNEYFTSEGKRWGNWLSVTPLPHDYGVGTYQGEEAETERFNHVAYRVEGVRDLFDAADRLRENGLEIDFGPGQHAITEGKYLYFSDPASGLRVELHCGGYLIFDPDWEPIAWTDDDIGVAGDHQWIGRMPEEGTPARRTIPY